MALEVQTALNYKANNTVNSTLDSEWNDPECEYGLHRPHVFIPTHYLLHQ